MKSKKTRERILDASLEMFNKKKASNVSTVQISAAMKISPGNLYYYYANKEDVIRCIWEERMSSVLNELLEKADNIKSAADLLDYLKDWMEYLINYRFFYTELSTLFINDEKLVELYKDTYKKMRDTFTDLVIRFGEEGYIINDDDVSKILAVQSAVASAMHMLNRYDVYSNQGVSDETFIGFSWIRIIAALEPIFESGFKAEMDAELTSRGFSKEKYMETLK
ncbi:MAG: TetR/AcrR family transcriptional regulator [Firmicutes bacterium]|nr:TetR/AcrR family transcriptional regulator [Bacillota bacterium]